MMAFETEAGGTLRGRLRVPGDKSISHRCVMLGALGQGDTEIHGLLEGEDVLSTIAAFRALGVTIEGPTKGHLRIRGVGLHGLKAPSVPLDMGNSGTAMRLLAGVLSGQAFAATLIGDASLSRRPMGRVADPLRAMGARIEAAQGGVPPLVIHGGPLRAIEYRLPVASAQVKSALLLAGLYAQGTTILHEPGPSRDHTERMLKGLGCALSVDGATLRLDGPAASWGGSTWTVPADLSSATFFLVAAAMTPGSDLLLEGVGVNPTRTGVLEILQLMGAQITQEKPRTVGGEPVADLRVRGRKLHGIEVPKALVPLAIDEFPALFVAAAAAEGETRVSGAAELRVKETDRIAVMARGLRALGVDAREQPDGLAIRGGPLRGGTVESEGDHRVAMAFAISALVADGAVRVHDCRNVDTSFPGFVPLAASVGLRIRAFGS